MPPPRFDLYLITDRNQTAGRDLCAVVEAALGGGVTAVQLREKDLDSKKLFELAEKLAALCQSYKAELFINDRIDIALAVDAAGVQLGKDSLSLETARALLGSEKSIGYSAHSLEEARAAEKSGADFILFGPVFFTPSKALFGAPQGVDRLRQVVAQLSVPVYAIGGLKSDHVAAVMQTGSRGIALISAIISAPDPADAARTLRAKLARQAS